MYILYIYSSLCTGPFDRGIFQSMTTTDAFSPGILLKRLLGDLYQTFKSGLKVLVYVVAEKRTFYGQILPQNMAVFSTVVSHNPTKSTHGCTPWFSMSFAS